MKFSKQRQLILDVILNNKNHLTADNIYNILKVDNPSLSLGTVYRNLSQLVENNIIKKVSLPNQPDKFDKNTEKHCHLMCEKCGEIFDVNYNNEIYKCFECSGDIIKSCEIVLSGVCKNCSDDKTT